MDNRAVPSRVSDALWRMHQTDAVWVHEAMIVDQFFPFLKEHGITFEQIERRMSFSDLPVEVQNLHLGSVFCDVCKHVAREGDSSDYWARR